MKDLLEEKNTLCSSGYTDKSALLGNDLRSYFMQNVIRLRDELDQCAVPDNTDTNSDLTSPFIDTFTPLTEEDVFRLIANSKSPSCCLDPIPKPLLKSCVEALIPVTTKIINISLDTGIFPVRLKVTVAIPLLKKLGVDLVFKNLRFVSNLAHISSL